MGTGVVSPEAGEVEVCEGGRVGREREEGTVLPSRRGGSPR